MTFLPYPQSLTCIYSRVQVTTRKCVAYDACTFNGQDDGIHQETVDHLSNTEASVVAKSKPCGSISSPGRHFEPSSSGQDNTRATVVGVIMERSEECDEIGGYVRVDM